MYKIVFLILGFLAGLLISIVLYYRVVKKVTEKFEKKKKGAKNG